MMDMPIDGVLCTEPHLEKQSLLLVRSIRRFAGRLRDIPLFSFSPRDCLVPSARTLGEFESLNVVHQNIPLNTRYRDSGVANKPAVCAYAEATIPAERLAFFDSDTVMLDEPLELLLDNGVDVAARPVDTENIGVARVDAGLGTANERYWQTLYEICGVNRIGFIGGLIPREDVPYGPAVEVLPRTP
jgi:hypothetical protein